MTGPDPKLTVRRYMAGVALFWTAAVGVLFLLQMRQLEQNTRELALAEARASFNKDQAFRFWATAHGGIYVPVDAETSPNLNLAHVPDRDIKTRSGRELTLMNPAWMVRELNESFSQLMGVRSHITSLKLLRKENAPDPWERQALERFERGESEVLEFSDIDGESHVRLMRPMMAEEGCLKCHGKQGYKVGDVRGGVSVSVPLGPYLKRQHELAGSAVLSYGTLWLLGLLGIQRGGRGLLRADAARRVASEQLAATNRCLAAEVREREYLMQEMEHVLRYTGEGILGLDAEGFFTQVNPAAGELLGWEPAELVGREHTVLLAPDSASPFLPTLHNGEVVHERDGQFLRRGGDAFPVEFICKPIRDEGRIIGAAVSFNDISFRKQHEASLHRLNRALRTLGRCNEALVRAQSEGALLEAVTRILAEDGGYRLAWVGYAERDGERRLRPMAAAGPARGFLDVVTISWREDAPLGQGPSGRAMRSGRVQLSDDLRLEPGLLPWLDQLRPWDITAGVALPLLDEKEHPFGVLTVYAADAAAFDTREVELLEELANDLAYGIRMLRTAGERDQAHAALENRLLQTIQTIALTVEKRDPYTAGHQQKVAALAEAIGAELGLDPDRLLGLRLGAIIHDIGKVSIPAEILNRPGRLSRIEFDIIKTHPETGYEIVAGVDFPWPVARMLREHHERMDGSGYPQGLRGEEIVLEARVIAVADVVEAITSHRPYRPARSLEDALAVIREGSGSHYDPKVVAACLRVFEEGRFRWS